jgi:hypothetical protein
LLGSGNRSARMSSAVRCEPSEIFSVILHFSTGHLFLVKALKMASIKEQRQTDEKQSRPDRGVIMAGDMEKKVKEEQSQARVERFVKWRSVEDEPSGSSDQEDGEKRYRNFKAVGILPYV